MEANKKIQSAKKNCILLLKIECKFATSIRIEDTIF